MSETRTVRLGDVCQVVSGATPKTSVEEYWDGDINWVTPADLSKLSGAYISETPRKITEAGFSSCATNLLPENSVLLSSRAPIGHVAINTVPMATNQGFKSLIPGDQILPKFLYYWIMDHKEYLQSLGVGATFKELSKKTVENIKLDIPPLEEQVKQVEIRDLQSMIAQKRERQQELFAELKSATFREMFLGKSFPNKKLFEVADTSSGATPNRSNKNFYKDGTIPWVKSGELHQELITSVSENITDEALEKTSVQLLPAGTVLIAMYGATVGAVSQLGIEATTNQAVCAIQIKNPCITETYLKYYLRSQYSYILSQAAGGAQPNINQGIIKYLNIPIPPLNEQIKFSEILSLINKNTS